jgi:hypothetical protein
MWVISGKPYLDNNMTTIKKATRQANQTTVSKSSTQVAIKAPPAQTVVNVATQRKPGRPKGSKNKPKEVALESPATNTETPKQNFAQGSSTSKRYDEVKQGNFQPTTVAQILGEDVRDKFGTSDEEDYHRKICAMSRREIFYHASQLNVPLNESLLRLRKNLLAEFRKHVSNFKIPKSGGTVIGTVPKKSNLTSQKVQTIREFKDAPDAIQEILDEVK